MSGRAFFLDLSLWASVMFAPFAAWSQVPAGGHVGGSSPLGELRTIEKQDWHIFGRVTTLSGEPVGSAKVRVNIGAGLNSVKTLETNLQGEFETEFSLDVDSYRRLSVKLVATKRGYLDAWENADFGSDGQSWGVDLVLREKAEDSDQLPVGALIASLAPRLRVTAPRNPLLGSERKDYLRGVQEFLDRHNPAGAVPHLAKVIEREPTCVECRTLLGLALLDAGSWASATRQFAEAAKQSAVAKAEGRRPEPLLILGVLEAWRRQEKKATGLFQKALEVDPANPLVLQELGRAFLFQQNWEAADRHLEKAIRAGASPEAHLLRARALLEEGDAEAAHVEMEKYLGGRDVRELTPTARLVWSQLKDRLELKAYGKVKSVVAQPLAELIRAMPELRGLEPAQSQEQLALILRKLGEDVEVFFRDFPNTSSLEEIRQERLRRDGKVQESLSQKFQYLLLARSERWGLGLEEYRSGAEGTRVNPHGLEGGFMLTSGFASASLLFHPAYQSGAAFRYLGRQVIDGHKTYVVAFAQRPETTRVMERFTGDESSVLVLVQGMAWVDPISYQIIRMRSDLLKPPPKSRLGRQTTEMRFGEVHFKETPSTLWLPREVAVTVEWKGKTLRNWHRYSAFKLFRVETGEKRKTAGLVPETPEDSN